MRWVAKYFGRERVRRAFLFLPRTISNETRWLERATWSERVVSASVSTLMWEAQEWIDLGD